MASLAMRGSRVPLRLPHVAYIQRNRGPMPDPVWARLAQLLAERRSSLRPEWAERTQFARDVGLSYRSLSDLENARRDNYKPSWLARIEELYRLEPGAVQRLLSGETDELEPKKSGDAPSTSSGGHLPVEKLDTPPEPVAVRDEPEWVEGISWWPSRRDPDGIIVYRMRWLGGRDRAIRREFITEADPETPLSVIVSRLEDYRRRDLSDSGE